MSQITQIEMWKDTGFQEGAIEVPSVNDILPELESSTGNYIKIAHDGGIRTSTEDFFSAFTIPEFFTDDILGFSYLRVHYTYNSGAEMTFYGWIDDISLKSDTADSPSVRIAWHIDYWRTYLASAKLGYGMVQSRPASDNDPPQSLSYRYRLGGDYQSLVPSVPGNDVNWLLFNYVKETDSSKSTKIRTCAVPIDKNNLDTNYFVKIGDNSIKTPSLSQVISGEFLTKMKISASQVTSAFLSPVPPFAIDRKDGTTYYPATSSTTTIEFIPSNVSDDVWKRVDSVRCVIVKSQAFTSYNMHVNFSDGTTATQGFSSTEGFLDWVHGFNGFAPGDKVTATRYYKYRLPDLMRALFPNTSFQNGEYIEIKGITTQMTDSVSFSSSGVYYNAILGSSMDETYTYNNGWPDVTFYSYNRLSAVFYGMRSSTQFSIGVEYPDQGELGYMYTNSQNYYEYSIDLRGIKTTDKSELVIIDMNGIPIATVPWGIALGKGTLRLITSSVSAYLEYRFEGPEYAHADGLTYTIPLPSVDIASNSWVDYVYSGQRDYDVSQRKIASQQALVSGITSSITGAASNAIMASIGHQNTMKNMREAASVLGLDVKNMSASGFAALEKAFGRGFPNTLLYGSPGGPGTHSFYHNKQGMNPLTAGVASLGVGVTASAAEYVISQYFNERLQKAEDMLQAKQFDSITVSGGGWDWLWHGCPPGIITLVADDYSLTRFENDKLLNGIYCSEPTVDCDYIRTSEGPYKIAELIVTGSIPVQARAHIKGRFANGVRIRTINTQTVTEGE